MIARKLLSNIASPPGRSHRGAAASSAAGAAGAIGRSGARWWPGVLAALLCAVAAGPAQAQQAPVQEAVDVEACLAAHLSGQELRHKAKLLESREQFRQCARQECPSAIARDCVDWLGQYERQIPSVAVRVTADGAGRPDARVLVDGAPVENLTGKAIELNPGEHVIRVELPPFEPFETKLLISEGDQFRVVDAQFATPRPIAPSTPQPLPERAPVAMERPVPMLSYVFGAVSLAAAGTGAGFGLSSWSLRNKAEKTCAPECSPKGVEVLKQRALIADISFGVSIASAIATVTLYVLRPEVPVEADGPVAFGLDVVPGGAVGSVSLSAF